MEKMKTKHKSLSQKKEPVESKKTETTEADIIDV